MESFIQKLEIKADITKFDLDSFIQFLKEERLEKVDQFRKSIPSGVFAQTISNDLDLKKMEFFLNWAKKQIV